MLFKGPFTTFYSFNHIHGSLHKRQAAVGTNDIIERLRIERSQGHLDVSPYFAITDWCIKNCQGEWDDNDVGKIDDIEFIWWLRLYREPPTKSKLFNREPRLMRYEQFIFSTKLNFELLEDAEYFFWVW